MDKFEVVREHTGDKEYKPGDLREIKAAEVSHLVPNVLIPATDDFVKRYEESRPKEPTKVWDGVGLREDGPTVAEYVEAGYLAANYPPKGYASRNTDDEVAAAVKAQSEKAAPAHQNKMEPDGNANKGAVEPKAETITTGSVAPAGKKRSR